MGGWGENVCTNPLKIRMTDNLRNMGYVGVLIQQAHKWVSVKSRSCRHVNCSCVMCRRMRGRVSRPAKQRGEVKRHSVDHSTRPVLVLSGDNLLFS